MSTGINIAPSSDLTVGTTAVTSGTDTRVFFQAGGVVQQDANFTFDNTLKRLTLKAVGTAATDIPFAVQNSAGTANLIDIKGDNNTTFYQYNAGLTNNSLNILNVNADTAARFDLGGVSTFNFVSLIQTKATAAGQGVPATANFRGFLYASNANGNHFVISANDGIAFSGQNPNGYNATSDQMRLKNGNLAIGTGYSASARLDIKAQGALSTDIAFRVRNSADTADLFKIRGNASTIFGGTGADYLSIIGGSNWGTDCYFDFSGGNYIRFLGQSGDISIFTNSSLRSRGTYIGGATQLVYFDNGGNIRIGQGHSNVNQPDINATRTIQQMTGVAPTTSVADGFQQYSADITAGNAAPHFRTENGAIVKVYQETTAVAASTLVGGGGTTLTDTDTFDGYTIQQIVKALRNQGLLA